MDKFFKFLNSDRYQYTESEIYMRNGMAEKMAVFDILLRTGSDEGYAVVYGIDEVMELIEALRNTGHEKRKGYLKGIADISEELIEYIAKMEFTGSVKGVRNGEIVFNGEPILTITAPLIQAKILETPILNILNYQIQSATVASKIVQSVKKIKPRGNNGTEVIFFGTRRAPGLDAGISINKAAYMVGCGSSSLIGEYCYNIKSVGTMTHSYIQSFGMGKEGEYRAFDSYIKAFKDKKKPLIMLVDTYGTMESGIHNAVKAFKENGIDDNYEGKYGIRIDSGNLSELSKECRKILGLCGFNKAKIVLTGGLDEEKINRIITEGGEADIFGVGEAISMPYGKLSIVYKMAKIDKKDVMKISEKGEKASLPGNKEIHRIYANNDFYDIIMLEEEEDGKEHESGILERKKITMDFILHGKKCEYTEKILSLEESKKYYEDNMGIIGNYLLKKGKESLIQRVKLSKRLSELRESLVFGQH